MLEKEDKYIKRFLKLMELSDLEDYSHLVPHRHGNCVVALGLNSQGAPTIYSTSNMRRYFLTGLSGEIRSSIDGFLQISPLNAENGALLRQFFPWSGPQSILTVKSWQCCENLIDNGLFVSDDLALPCCLTFEAFQRSVPQIFTIVSPQNIVHLEDDVAPLAALNSKYLNKTFVVNDKLGVKFTPEIVGYCQAVAKEIALKNSTMEEILVEGSSNIIVTIALIIYLGREIRSKKIARIGVIVEQSNEKKWYDALVYGNIFVVEKSPKYWTIYDQNVAQSPL